MGGRTPEDLKNEIIAKARRAKEMREAPPQVEEIEDDGFDEGILDFEEMVALDDGEEDFDEESLGEDFVFDLEAVRQEGFAAFVFDANPVNPYITEGEDGGELFLKEVWEQGFSQAHQHTCMSYLMLSLRDFFTATTDAAAEEALAAVEESYEAFADIISFEDIEGFIELVENPDSYEDPEE